MIQNRHKAYIISFISSLDMLEERERGKNGSRSKC